MRLMNLILRMILQNHKCYPVIYVEKFIIQERYFVAWILCIVYYLCFTVIVSSKLDLWDNNKSTCRCTNLKLYAVDLDSV